LARRSLLFNSSVYIVGQFLSKALAFVLLVVYARFLQEEDFGITGTLSAYGAVVGTIFVLGTSTSVGRHYFDLKKDPAELRSYVTSVYAFQIAFSVALVVVLELFGGSLWERYTSGAIPFSYVRLALWATFLTMLVQIPLTLYQSEERAQMLVGWQLLQGVLAVGVGFVFVGWLRERALGVLRSQVVAAALVALPLGALFVRNYGSRVLRWRHVRAALVYGLPLLPHSIGTILMQSVDRIMLEKYVPQDELGRYSIGMTLGLVLGMIAGGVNQAWAPHFFRTSSEERPEEARHKAEVFASLFVAMFTVLGLVGALLGNELILVLGASYRPVVPYLVPFVIGNLIGIYYYLPANQLLLASKTFVFIVATGVATVVSIGLNMWFLPRGYGGMAAAWIFVGGVSVQTGVIVLAARLTQKSLLGVRHAAVFALAVAALVASMYGLALPYRAALLVACGLATYVLLVRANWRYVLPPRA
jgi:O-antigen/teichoic acid export membrane protein